MKRKQLLLLLALLMTVVTGAWAKTAPTGMHRITATIGSKSATMDVQLPYESTLGDIYKAVTGSEPMSALTVTAASVKSGTNVTIGTQLKGWDTTADVTDDGDATVSISIGMIGTEPSTTTITINVAPITYSAKMKAGTEDAKNWTIASGQKSATGDAADGLTGLNAKDPVTLTYSGRLKVKSVTATSDYDPLTTPLTVEAISAGTIKVKIGDGSGTLSTGMKYSKDGRTTKTLITQSTDIPVAKGDKVQFYGNGTQTQAYGNSPEVKILGSGDGFQTKVYGNIMSLLDEEGFATKTDLPNAEYVFFELFAGNTTLIDASELLLPAATLTNACYQAMFEGCTNLTTAPKLPAETLADACYQGMFEGCISLTTAYVKAAYTEVAGRCSNMFDGCTAGAVLHTTPGYSKERWETMMGEGKTWYNWTVADDWED